MNVELTIALITLVWMVVYSLFVAYKVFAIHKEVRDGLDWLQGSGDYGEKGNYPSFAEDLAEMVNNKMAGGLVGTVGDIAGPSAKLLGERLADGIEQMITERAEKVKARATKPNAGRAEALLVTTTEQVDAKSEVSK